MRICLEPQCGEFTTRTRCRYHEAQREQLRVARRGNLYSGNRYRARRAEAIQAQPYCGFCGAVVDLTADHVVPGDPDSALRVLCRPCNSALARRRGARA